MLLPCLSLEIVAFKKVLKAYTVVKRCQHMGKILQPGTRPSPPYGFKEVPIPGGGTNAS